MSGSRNDHVQVKAEYSLALRHLALEFRWRCSDRFCRPRPDLTMRISSPLLSDIKASSTISPE